MVKLNKCILARKINSNKTVYLYPKTSADMIIYMKMDGSLLMEIYGDF